MIGVSTIGERQSIMQHVPDLWQAQSKVQETARRAKTAVFLYTVTVL